MNIRSNVIAVAVLVLSTTAGPAQDWMFPITNPRANPAPTIDPKADPAPVIDPKANPAPAIDLKADPAPARDWTQNLYANVGASYLYQQDTTLTESIGGLPTTSGTATFYSGFRGDVVLGYNVSKSWAVEFNTGVLWNSMDSFEGVSMSSVDQTFDTYTIPFLANLVYRIPLTGPFSAYVGAGAGGAASILHYTAGIYDPGDYTFVFAYQAKAGVGYALSKHASLGVAYQFFGTTDPNWQFTVNYVGGMLPPTDISFKEKGFYTHALTISLTWSF